MKGEEIVFFHVLNQVYIDILTNVLLLMTCLNFKIFCDNYNLAFQNEFLIFCFY